LTEERLFYFPLDKFAVSFPDSPNPIHSESGEERNLSSGVKPMPREFFDPIPEEQVIVLVERRTVRDAEGLIKCCEHCNPEDAVWPFAVILDRITGSDPDVTDYILETPARCPSCLCEILEQTHIEPA